MTDLTKPDQILKLQNAILKSDQQVDLITSHHFSKGLYARELTIPAGVIVVGAKHLTTHMFMIVKGRCKVSSQFGEYEVEAPFIGETIPKTKRVILAITDCVWITFHPTDLTDVKEIEKAILEPEDI